jgi:hypothetical protein
MELKPGILAMAWWGNRGRVWDTLLSLIAARNDELRCCFDRIAVFSMAFRRLQNSCRELANVKSAPS